MSESESEPRQNLRRTNKVVWLIPAVALVGAAGLIYWQQRHGGPPPAPPPPTPEVPVAAPTPPPATPATPTAAAPDARATIEGLSSDPTWKSWVAQGDPVRRWAVVTDNLAEGVSPRKALSFLAPQKPFAVAYRGDTQVIDPESYHRYDAFADVVGKLDAGAVASAYRAIHGVLETAYRALGYPGASLDKVTARALRRLSAAQVPQGDVAVVADGGVYLFQDPKLEGLSEVDKHLIRMGPRNAKIVQAKAREIAKALDMQTGGRSAQR